MAKNNNNEYVVSIKADIKNLKQDIKSELQGVLREVDSVGEAVANGITPDTKEFETKLASLEAKMEKLANSTKDVEQQVASMKTAFKGFTELEATMKVIGEQNKVMYDTFVKMTPYIQEFAKTFTAMKPEQAGAAFAAVMQNMSASGAAGTQTFKDMQSAAQQASNVVKNSLHEVETSATGSFNAVKSTVETVGSSIGSITPQINNLAKDLERVKKLKDEAFYEGRNGIDIKSKQGQAYLLDDIKNQANEYKTLQSSLDMLERGTQEWNSALVNVIESAIKLNEMTLNFGNQKQLFSQVSGIQNLDVQIDEFIGELEESVKNIPQQISKVELKPIKLKVDLSTDDEIIGQINKALDRIKDNVKINPINIPLNFVNQDATEDTDKQVKKTKKKKKTTEEVNIDAVKSSFEKEIENIQKSFEKIKQPLLNEVKQWRENLEEYLTLQFKWKKGDKEGIVDLFDDISHYAETNPIWLNPDTDKLIAEIESALTQHKFNLNLNGATNITGNLSGAVPVAIVGGTGSYQMPVVKRVVGQGITSSTSTIKSESKKEIVSVDNNSKAIQKNSDVILDVINEFKTYAKSGNDTINNARKTIENLNKQNEKLDKNNPKDTEKIAGNNEKIKKTQKKISDQQDRFDALRSRTGIDVQNIANINDNVLYETILHLVQDRNEIVSVLNTTKIGGATNSKTFLTKGIRNLVDSISNAQQMLGVEMKEADTVSKELAAKDYLKDAEQLARMGMVLKTANREIRDNIVPTEDALQQVVDVFGGRGLTSVSKSAQGLKNALGQYDELFSSDGGYQQYVNRLNDEITQIQSEITELSKHPRKNKSAIVEKKNQLSTKTSELNEVQQNVEPVLNEFKNSIKGLPGQIAELLKGYKFIVEFVDADGKKVVESFNDASAKAPQNTEPYYKRTAKMFDRINAGEITSITPKSTPNDAAISMLYGDKLSKTNAVQKVIDAYDKLDDQARKFVDTLIDINKLTNENINVSQKWAHIEESGLLDRNNSGQIGRSIYANNKFKKNQSMDNFLNEVVEAYFGVAANGRLRAGTQKMLMRGTPISYGSYKNATVAHPEERNYGYSSTDRQYRTVPNYEQKTIEQLNAELLENKAKTDEVNAQLVTYKESLKKAQESHQQEYENQLSKSDYSPEKLKKIQDQYPDIQSYSGFTTAQKILEKNTTSARESKQKIESQNQQNNEAVKGLTAAIESREKYIEQLKKIIDIFEKNKNGVLTNIENIKDKELKNIAYAGGIQTLDRKSGKVRNLTRNEYLESRRQQLSLMESQQSDDQQKLTIAKEQLESSTIDLTNATNKLNDAEIKLKNLRTAFASEYVKYLQDLIDNTYVEEKELDKKNKIGQATTEEKGKLSKITLERAGLYQEKEKYESVYVPNIKTGFESQISQLATSINNAESKLDGLEVEKKNIENKISNLANDIVPVATTPVEFGSEQAKTLALREVEKIDADINLADKKIEVAEQKKKELDNRIKVLQKKGAAAQEVKQSQNQATGYATQAAKNSDEYKKFQRELHQQFKDGAITWDEYSAKIQAKIDEIVSKLKETEPNKYTGKSADELELSLNKEKKVYQNYIKEAKAKKKELQEQRQEAIAFAQLSEEELATQRAITEEKKEQVAATQQEVNIQTQQQAESRIEEKAIQIDQTRIQYLNDKISEIDNELTQLQVEAKSNKNKKDTKVTKKLTDKQQGKINQQFLDYVSQIKAKEINKGINVKDVDLSEAINMQKQLNALAEQGNQNTEEYLLLQRKLSELISKRTNQLKGSGRQGYATPTEKHEWLKTNVSEDVASFYSSEQYVAQQGKFDTSVANALGDSLVKDFSNEFKAQCVAAAKKAYDDAIASGKAKKDAKKAAIRTVQQLISSVEQGVTEGVVEEVKEPDNDNAGKKARIRELTKQKAQLVAEKDGLIAQSAPTAVAVSSDAQFAVGGFAIQADNVVVNGNTVGTSGDGSGPWALETTLKATNEILNNISSKIDAIKGGSGSGDDSSTGSSGKKKKEQEYDVDSVKQRLYAAADEDLTKSFGEGTKSVRRFDERTLKLHQTLTLANGETVKLTYSINKMSDEVKSSYTTIANFESIAKKAYTELGANKVSTNNLIGNNALHFPVDKVNAYNQALTELDTKLKSLGKKGVTNPEDANQVRVLTESVKKVRTEIEGMYKSSYKLSSEHDLVKTLGADDVGNIEAQMKKLAQEAHNGTITFNGFNEETNELTFSFSKNKNELTTLTYKFDELTNSVYKTGQASKTTTGFFQGFFSGVGKKIGELARYYTGMSLLTEAIQQVRRGVQYVREIDLALTELKKVTDESESSYNRFLQTMSNTAGVVGSTVSELTNSAAAWARLNI